MSRIAEITRRTSETSVHVALSLDGPLPARPGTPAEGGGPAVRTGFGLLDHMLSLTAFWAGFDLRVLCEGDLDVDAHHSAEDVGLCLGQALGQALGERRGIARVGFSRVPMDEALAEVTLDLSGRPWLEWRGDALLPPVMAGEERDLWREWYKSVATAGRMNLHISFLYGKNGHHLLESAAKGLGLALAQAVAVTGSMVRSTKGSLDV